ncbi:LysM peptidoglycan-binding domain-containing protein [Leifsonia sp. AG29]|uniref:LysM peptidoglycan-binding domain-containing protein n=1 Tax=Leifsonia sp. AG29 TaxID=2598860 RepID=UPI00131ED148
MVIVDAGSARSRSSEGRSRARTSPLLTLPIAVVGTVAVAMNLVTPSAAATRAPETERSDRTGDAATAAPSEITSSIARTAQTSAAETAVAAAPAQYTVRQGDTVSGIAARFGLSTAGILAVNGLSWKSLIFPGQVLALAGASAPATTAPAARPAAAQAPAPAPAPSGTAYTIVRGDTVSGIAARFGVPARALLAANGLSSGSLIFPGQRLAIPGITTAAVTVAAPVSAPAPAPAPAPAAAAPAPLPAAPPPGAVVTLSDEMRANAQLIVRVARQEGVPDQGIVVALAAAAQESGLRNVRYGDRDSLGLFQQRPSMGWGTPKQVLDPIRATQAFFGGPGNPNPGRTRGLLDIAGWRSMSVTQAAQAVQRSAYPDAYAAWEASARAWLGQLG